MYVNTHAFLLDGKPVCVFVYVLTVNMCAYMHTHSQIPIGWCITVCFPSLPLSLPLSFPLSLPPSLSPSLPPSIPPSLPPAPPSLPISHMYMYTHTHTHAHVSCVCTEDVPSRKGRGLCGAFLGTQHRRGRAHEEEEKEEEGSTV